MKVGVLTSSRADYGIYLPLLQLLESDAEVALEIIAFGMHISVDFGNTVKDIEQDRFIRIHKLQTMLEGDSPEDISASYANTVRKFAKFWAQNQYDWVICLGDRYEMNAAVQASIPFGVKLAHIHGGETTLGAIDNIYRHQISLASKLHFCSHEEYASRVREFKVEDEQVLCVGALGLDNLDNFTPKKFDIWIDQFELKGLKSGFILMTVHPETVAWERNLKYARELDKAIEQLLNVHQVLVTMPNADTMGSVFRRLFIKLNQKFSGRLYLVENFGTEGYYTAMHYAALMLGNTSSGITEGASFGNYVVDIGNRQKGRITGPNIIHAPFNSAEIVEAVQDLIHKPAFSGSNIFYKGGAAQQITDTLKNTMVNPKPLIS